MSKIFVGQTKLRIYVSLSENITGYQDVLIKYQKPDSTNGSFIATVETENPGRVYYDVENASDLDQPGEWTFWGHVTFTDGKTIPGCAVKHEIHSEGE